MCGGVRGLMGFGNNRPPPLPKLCSRNKQWCPWDERKITKYSCSLSINNPHLIIRRLTDIRCADDWRVNNNNYKFGTWKKNKSVESPKPSPPLKLIKIDLLWIGYLIRCMRELPLRAKGFWQVAVEWQNQSVLSDCTELHIVKRTQWLGPNVILLKCMQPISW